jgi:hypothetical protein
MIESMEELEGYIDVLGQLRDIWHDLTNLYNNKMRIFKERHGMNRDREMWVHNAREKIMEIRNLIEKTIQDILKDIKGSFKF